MRRKYLVTGGAGFIGSHLAEGLLERGYKVTVLDNLENSIADPDLDQNSQLSFVKGSVTDRSLVRELVAEHDAVFHLAAMLGVKTTMTHTIEMVQNNLAGTSIILEEAMRTGKKVVFASTSEVYGKGEPPFSENMDLRFGNTTKLRWSYALGKSLEECLCLAYGRKKLPITIVRYFNIFGPRQKDGSYGGVVSRFIKAALTGEDLLVYGDGSQTRSFTYVSDAVEGTIRCLEEKADQEIFNVGSRNEITILGLATKIKNLTKSSSNIVHIPFDKVYPHGFEEIPKRSPDINKIETILQYEPQVKLEQGLKESIGWYRRKLARGELS
ncbi:NAD-dependent dehydratase [Ammoniphilus oxalaticus]|uniref:NAD-dependent dehydratase n=1 Tax=Ammoniphilus oxalaticus TaxID=66863 RepID=A0A419SL57_9BACL|nr:NAD-dependent epimerase/dehydratase family protein [Ammoniphilus oxalaticus]RKD24722.1 NAD-dependent dehydratase [Ammoniphilus oxalaticus]